MPRTLPWLAEKTASDKAPRAHFRPTGKPRSESPSDLVGSDLEDLEEEPARPTRVQLKKQVYRESSSSPPPSPKGPPPVEYMKPGYAADDIWMMVEDEFYSTAQLYTQHLHQQEYARLKKLHKSRGRETLAALERPTDGRTPKSREIKVKLQQDDNAKNRRQAVAADSASEEDDFMDDARLATLMTGSQVRGGQEMTRTVKAGSKRTRIEIGHERPDPLSERGLSPVDEEADQDQETESDDLDAPVRKHSVQARTPVDRPTSASKRILSSDLPVDKAPGLGAGFFKSSSRVKREEQNNGTQAIESSSLPSSPPLRISAPARRRSELDSSSSNESQVRRTAQSGHATVKAELASVNDDQALGLTPIQVRQENESRAGGYLARRRAQKEKEHADARRREVEESIPTFLF